MNILRIPALIVTFMLSFVSAFAIDAPSNLSVESANDKEVNLSWDAVEGSIYYNVFFGEVSGGEYDLESDIIEENNLTLDGLEAGKKYYAVVVSLDHEAIESNFSDEISFSLEKTKLVENNSPELFVFSGIEVIDFDRLKLSFSEEISNNEGSLMEFKLINKDDDLEVINIKDSKLSELDRKIVDLTLESPLEKEVEYELIVIAINNVDGDIIESGLDSTQIFSIEKGFEPKEVEKESILNQEDLKLTGESNSDLKQKKEDEKESISNQEDLKLMGEPNSDLREKKEDEKEEDEKELILNQKNSEMIEEFNSAAEQDSINNNAMISGKEVKEVNDVIATAGENEKLPDTGPEHILIFILATILATLIFVFKYKKV